MSHRRSNFDNEPLAHLPISKFECRALRLKRYVDYTLQAHLKTDERGVEALFEELLSHQALEDLKLHRIVSCDHVAINNPSEMPNLKSDRQPHRVNQDIE